MLNPIVGGNHSRILETTRKLQIMQAIAVSSIKERNLNPAIGGLVFVGITLHPSHRLGMKEQKRKKKNEK